MVTLAGASLRTQSVRDRGEALALDADRVVVARDEIDMHALPQDRREDESIVVVGVLADEIDAPGCVGSRHRYILTVPPTTGRAALERAEQLPRDQLDSLRREWWEKRTYVYVTPGEELVKRALAGFPDDVRALAGRCRILRPEARSGGGYYSDRNEVELAAGVETYEGLHQVELSACHELFHYVCWNDRRYRADEDQNFPYLRRAVRESRKLLPAFARYRDWVTGSFLRQGDHANPVEYFADIPTNFRDTSELPPPIRTHFAPLIDGAPLPYDLAARPDWPIARDDVELATFQRWLAGRE